MWWKKDKPVEHRIAKVKHLPKTDGKCIVWVYCECGDVDKFQKLDGVQSSDDDGVHTLASVVDAHPRHMV